MLDLERMQASRAGQSIALTARELAFLELLIDPVGGVVFAAERVVGVVPDLPAGQRPLFILLDATWPEARKMFRKSPYLNRLPVLSLAPEQVSRYQLRRSKRDDHFCTSEVASLCLELAGEPHAADTLQAYLDVYTHHYLQAKHQLPPDLQGPAHERWQGLKKS
mgnify:CR=1 FL=1